MELILEPTFTPCAACGRRPGTVQVVYGAGGDRRSGALCETCARELMARSATNGSAPADGSGSATPALDEFGRDLTAEAPPRAASTPSSAATTRSSRPSRSSPAGARTTPC